MVRELSNNLHVILARHSDLDQIRKCLDQVDDHPSECRAELSHVSVAAFLSNRWELVVVETIDLQSLDSHHVVQRPFVEHQIFMGIDIGKKLPLAPRVTRVWKTIRADRVGVRHETLGVDSESLWIGSEMLLEGLTVSLESCSRSGHSRHRETVDTKKIWY